MGNLEKEEISPTFQRDFGVPTELTFLKGCRVKAIAAGGHQSACLAETRLAKFLDLPKPPKKPVRLTFHWGEKFICRSDDGYEGRWICTSLPHEIRKLHGRKIGDIKLGKKHCLVLDEDVGRIYAWGDNTYGQLGLVGTRRKFFVLLS